MSGSQVAGYVQAKGGVKGRTRSDGVVVYKIDGGTAYLQDGGIEAQHDVLIQVCGCVLANAACFFFSRITATRQCSPNQPGLHHRFCNHWVSCYFLSSPSCQRNLLQN